MSQLLTLDEAIKPYSISKRTARRLIAAGKLPASQPGRELLVNPDDLARLLAPTLRPAAAKPRRESETSRIERQLAEAGLSR
jgi:excisionase family DNA binding protein